MRCLVVLLVALGCKHEPERAPTAPSVAPKLTADAATPVVDAVPMVLDAGRPVLDAACPPRAKTRDPGATKNSTTDQCKRHADCNERPHGRCVHQPWHDVYTFGQRKEIAAHNECVYDECTSDEECRRTSPYEPRAESVCECAADKNYCTFANCRKDSDCAAPYTCGAWHYCHAAADACGPKQPCKTVGSSRVDLQACKLEYSIVSPK